MDRCATLLAVLTAVALAVPAAAQQPTNQQATPVPESVVKVRPTNLAPITLEPRTATTPATPAQPASPTRRSSTTLMIVGGAAMLAGAVIGGDAGNVFMVGGAVIGLIGLYHYLR